MEIKQTTRRRTEENTCPACAGHTGPADAHAWPPSTYAHPAPRPREHGTGRHQIAQLRSSQMNQKPPLQPTPSVNTRRSTCRGAAWPPAAHHCQVRPPNVRRRVTVTMSLLCQGLPSAHTAHPKLTSGPKAPRSLSPTGTVPITLCGQASPFKAQAPASCPAWGSPHPPPAWGSAQSH